MTIGRSHLARMPSCNAFAVPPRPRSGRRRRDRRRRRPHRLCRARRGRAVRLDARQRTNCDGRWITPGLIDCHTHLVYGGNRAQEFEQRLAGASYEEIARAGGGIVSTVKATRQASTEQLIAATLPRLDALIAEGVTTIEIKSGYGLELDTERRQLQAARQLGSQRAISVRTTFLGAHTVPPEMKGNSGAYIDAVCNTMLPQVAAEGLADAVDAFCEGIAFSPDETARVFAKARELGLPVRLHADQLSNLHGAALAARFGALSADHLEYADEDGIAAMARTGTVAVVLPGAFYFMRERQTPPIEAMRRHGVPIALATDSNPGTSPLTSLLLAMNMGATLFRLTVDECIAGGDAGGGARARTVRGNRQPRRREILRSRHLGHRAAGRARLPDRLQSASCPGVARRRRRLLS